MRYRIVLIRQPGLVPKLICWLTRSRWNHVGLIDDGGRIWDLDYSGPGIYRIEDRPAWKFKVLSLEVTCAWLSRVHSLYRYNLTQNLNWVFAKAGIRKSFYQAESPKKNCVGMVSDVFRRSDWAALAPGDFERMVSDGIS